MNEKKPVLLSGIQPSGNLCIGNYLGAIKNWKKLQYSYDSIFLVVDMHALTIKQNPSELRKRCLSYVAQYIACGIDPEKSTIVIQSHVPQHTELMWILSTISYIGELNRMTQYKDKSNKNSNNINAGLFTYPILMASDILIYQADLVPVGADQKQHLELARDLAGRFNMQYSETFVIPKPYIQKEGARVMSLQEPNKKMSKSDENLNNLIAILDSPEIIRKKIQRAVTDSDNKIRYNNNNPGISNLMMLYSTLSSNKIAEVENKFRDKKYSEFKKELGDLCVDYLSPIRNRYNEIINEKSYLESVLIKGAEEANYRARKTITKVYRKVGFIPKINK